MMWIAVQCARRISETVNTIGLVVLVFGAIHFIYGERLIESRSPAPTYELYSWQDSANRWKFSLLLTTSREKTIREVFDKRAVLRDLGQLKRKICTLDAGSIIILVGRLPTGTGPRAKGSERLRYPTSDTIQEIRSFAEAHKVQVLGP